ncbi:Hypothetical protein, putative [Bodo saltans]|uniref:Uncharacterized protein n=1 Tax=Bodo saltans TaxID=75058 RepID=A0A0S4IYB2_BODSA|nr:Hypothetical protein, putative [Bodo saltans]|eukprot:CUG48875.1 Hypothetical protein, putative [Bodo saltans]
MQGSDEPVHVPPPSSDEETEGESEQQVAVEAKMSQSRSHLEKSLELLGVFPTGIERGYCIIPRSTVLGGISRKRRVVQVVVEDAYIGSTVLALWNDNHVRPGAAAAAAFSGTTPKSKVHPTDADLGEEKFWPATIRRFTGEYVGLTDLADGALRSFVDFDLVEDHANTLPFLLCVDIAFAVDESESRQRLVWSGDSTSPTDFNSAKSSIMSPKSNTNSGGPMILLPSNLPSVVSVRNYSVVDASRGGDYHHCSGAAAATVGGRRRASSLAVENPMIGGPISGNEIVFERAHKSRRFTVLTVRDAGVVVQAKQQALRDLRDRWRRARAALPALSPKPSQHSLGGSASEVLLPSSSQIALRTPEPTPVNHGSHRRRLVTSGDTAAPPAPPSFVASHTQPANAPHSFVDLHDVGTAPRSATPPVMEGRSAAHGNGSVCESPPRSDRLHAKSQVNAPRHDRRSQTGADVVAIPRLQGAAAAAGGGAHHHHHATVATSSQLPSDAHHSTAPPHLTHPPRRETEVSHHQALQGHLASPASILVGTNITERRSVSPPTRRSPATTHHVSQAQQFDEDAEVEEKVEQLEEELAKLRRLLHERSRHQSHHTQHEQQPHCHSPTVADAPFQEADLDHLGSTSDDYGASPAPVPRAEVPRPRTKSPLSHHKDSTHSPKHQKLHQEQGGTSGSVKLWRKAQDQSFPPNSYVYVDPNARSSSPFDTSGRSQLQQQRPRGLANARTTQHANGGTSATRHHEHTPAQSTIPGRTPRSAIAIDAHYHRSLAYKETVKRAMEDVRKKGLDVVRKQQKQHAELFRRDTRELDSSPVLQRKRTVIDKAERSASRSPLGSRTPSVASRGGVSPFRGTSPTHQQQTQKPRTSSSTTNDVFARLTQSSSSKPQGKASPHVYVPPPPIGRSSSASTRGIVAAVSGGARVRRSISPDFDVTAPVDDDDVHHNNDMSDYSHRRTIQSERDQQRTFHMPTLARGFQS